MPDVVTIREAVERAKSDGLPVSEYTLRQWVKIGAVPARWVGQKALLFYPNLVRYLQCEDGGDNTTPTAKALQGFAWGTRGQFFWDGNKRTSMTLANKILISAGVGFLTITDKHMEQFNTLLVAYYDTGDSEALKDFLYANCIHGIS